MQSLSMRVISFSIKMSIVYGAAAYEYPLQRDFIIGILEGAFGVGFTLGPLCG